MTDLIQTLQSADAPSRELDAAIHVAAANPQSKKAYFVLPKHDVLEERVAKGCVWEKERGFAYTLRTAPPYTASLDSALALVAERLPGWTIARMSQDDNGLWFVELREGFATSYTKVKLVGPVQSLAIALLIALLRALEAEAINE